MAARASAKKYMTTGATRDSGSLSSCSGIVRAGEWLALVQRRRQRARHVGRNAHALARGAAVALALPARHIGAPGPGHRNPPAPAGSRPAAAPWRCRRSRRRAADRRARRPAGRPRRAKLPGLRNWVCAASASPTAKPTSAPWKRSRKRARGIHDLRRARRIAAGGVVEDEFALLVGFRHLGPGVGAVAALPEFVQSRRAPPPARARVRSGGRRPRCRCGRCPRGNARRRAGRWRAGSSSSRQDLRHVRRRRAARHDR